MKKLIATSIISSILFFPFMGVQAAPAKLDPNALIVCEDGWHRGYEVKPTGLKKMNGEFQVKVSGWTKPTAWCVK